MCINKVALARHSINYANEKYYIPIRIVEAYSHLKIRCEINPRDTHGPICYEYSGYLDYMNDVNYFPLLPSRIDELNFYLDIDFLLKHYKKRGLDVEASLDSFRNPVDIQYTILKIRSDPAMERRIHRSVIVDNISSKVQYPENTCSKFRCDFLNPVDTSQDTGRPYVQLNSVTIPAILNFREILRTSKIHLQSLFDKEDLSDLAHMDADEFRQQFDLSYSARKEIVGDDALITLDIPLIMPDDDNIQIQGFHNLKKQIKKRLDPLKIMISKTNNNKISIKNESEAKKIAIRFEPPSLAAALGHVNRKVIIPDPEHDNLRFARGVELMDESIGAIEFDIFRLAPNSLYIYCNFIDESYVNSTARRLLAVLETSESYDMNGKRIVDNVCLPVHNKRPIISHVNTNVLKYMEFELETSDGSPYPFHNQSGSDICYLNLSFLYK